MGPVPPRGLPTQSGLCSCRSSFPSQSTLCTWTPRCFLRSLILCVVCGTDSGTRGRGCSACSGAGAGLRKGHQWARPGVRGGGPTRSPHASRPASGRRQGARLGWLALHAVAFHNAQPSYLSLRPDPPSPRPAPGWDRTAGRRQSMCPPHGPPRRPPLSPGHPLPDAGGHRRRRTTTGLDVSQAWSKPALLGRPITGNHFWVLPRLSQR